MAAMPHLVGRANLVQARALTMLSMRVATILSPALGGLLVAGAGVGWVYLLTALGTGLTVLTLLGLPRMMPEGKAGENPLRAMAQAFVFLFGHKVILSVVALGCLTTVATSIRILFPALVEEVFGGGAFEIGLMYRAVPIGATLGAALSGWAARLERPGLAMGGACMGAFACIAVIEAAGSLAGASALLAAAFPAAAQTRVKVSAVVAAPVRQTLQLPGTLVSPQSSALSAPVEGRVERLLAEAGDRVEAGRILLRLDDAIARLELERLEHALAEAEHLHRDAQRLAREAEALVGVQSVSQSRYRTQLAQAAIEEAKVRQLRAAVAIQREQVARHALTAPFAGVVTERRTGRGQWVGAGGSVLQLTATDPLRVVVDVPERLHGRIEAGTRVTVLAADAEDGAGIGAAVERVVPAADPVSRSFRVHIALPNPEGRLMPGMSARVSFALGPAPGTPEIALQVPADAVQRHPDGSARVWVVQRGDDGAVARPVAVRTGRHSGDRVEVLSDELRPDDLVVVQGNEGLRPNQPLVPDTVG